MFQGIVVQLTWPSSKSKANAGACLFLEPFFPAFLVGLVSVSSSELSTSISISSSVYRYNVVTNNLQQFTVSKPLLTAIYGCHKSSHLEQNLAD
jgi:hypothetical protein